jgi:hypothetical protein
MSKVLAGGFIGLFLLTGVGAAFDMRRRLVPRPAPAPRTLPEVCRALAAQPHHIWLGHSLTEADVLYCNRTRVEEHIEELKTRGLVSASIGGTTRFARGVTAGMSVPLVKAVLSGEMSRSVELVLDPSKVGDTLRLCALLDLLIRKKVLSCFIGRPLEWDALNELARAILPDAVPGDLLIRPEDETVIKIASRHFGHVLDDGMRRLSLVQGRWSVSNREGRRLARQRVDLPGPLQMRSARVSGLFLDFNVADEVELSGDAAAQTLNCWVLGKIVRHAIVEEEGVTVLSLHMRTVALLSDEGFSRGEGRWI